jgi:hypothetical protein
MKTEKQIALAAAEFAERWRGKGDEKSESQMFWTDLLQNVFGVEDVTSFITYPILNCVLTSAYRTFLLIHTNF